MSTQTSDADPPAQTRGLPAIRARLRGALPHLRERYRVERLGIFGSHVRGEATPESDVDLLVTFSEKPDLFAYANLERHLEEIVGLPVDVGMPSELKAFAREQAGREVEYL
jgi:predicted nucleotidyltransferase